MSEPEWMETEEEKETKNLPEAPLSIHIDSYYKGFHVGFTIRKPDNSKLPSTAIKEIIDSLADKGYEPSWNTDTNNQVKQQTVVSKSDHKCLECGADAVYKSGTSSKGKKWAGYFCSADKDHEPKWV